MTSEIHLAIYLPSNVTAFLTTGTNSFIGLVDETTILKYPCNSGDEEALATLDLEARILQTIGPHKHIIGFKGLTKDGLLLERADNGSVKEFLEANDPPLRQRLAWIYQAAEALATVHKQPILHRDISASNFLLDADLNIKLSDFQGRLLGPNGDVEEDGLSVENTKSFMPRLNTEHADWRTEIFALGSAFYYIMEGHDPYPDLDSTHDEEKIEERFKSQEYPEVMHAPTNRVVHKCWAGEYGSVEAVLQDLKFIREDSMA